MKDIFLTVSIDNTGEVDKEMFDFVVSLFDSMKHVVTYPLPGSDNVFYVRIKNG